MRRFPHVVALFALAATASGCWWGAPGRGHDRNSYNQLEAGFDPTTVRDFVELWTATTDETGPRGVAHPVTSKGGFVHVTSTQTIYTYDHASGALVWSHTPPDAGGNDTTFDTDMYVISPTGEEQEGLFPTYRRNDTYWVPVQYDPATGGGVESEFNSRVDAMRPWNVLFSEYAEEGGKLVQRFWLLGAFDPTLVTEQPDLGNRLTLGVTRVFHSGVGVGTGPANGVRAFGVLGLALLWSTPIDGTRSTTPVVHPDQTTVYVGTDAGTLYALDAASGAVEWSAPLGSAITAPPALAEDTLFVPTASGSLVVLPAGGCGGRATCAPSWSTPAGAALTVQPGAASGVVFTGSADGTLAAFPLAGCGTTSCGPLWSSSTGSRITGAPAVSFGKVFVGTEDGRLVAYGLPVT